jgi:hypothetical protein
MKTNLSQTKTNITNSSHAGGVPNLQKLVQHYGGYNKIPSEEDTKIRKNGSARTGHEQSVRAREQPRIASRHAPLLLSAFVAAPRLVTH